MAKYIPSPDNPCVCDYVDPGEGPVRHIVNEHCPLHGVRYLGHEHWAGNDWGPPTRRHNAPMPKGRKRTIQGRTEVRAPKNKRTAKVDELSLKLRPMPADVLLDVFSKLQSVTLHLSDGRAIVMSTSAVTIEEIHP